MKRFFAIAAAVILTVVFLVVSQTKACYEPIFSLISQDEEVEETVNTTAENVETTITEDETEETQSVSTSITTDVIPPLDTAPQTSLETTVSSSCPAATTITANEESEPYTGGTYSVMSGGLYADEDVTEDFISGYTVICNSIPDGTIIYIESPTYPDIDNYYQVVNTPKVTQEEIEFFFSKEEIPNSFSETEIIIDLYVSIVTNTFHRETISEEIGENQEY